MTIKWVNYNIPGKNIYDRAGDKVNSNRAGTGILFKIRAFGEESDKISADMMFLRCIEEGTVNKIAVFNKKIKSEKSRKNGRKKGSHKIMWK